MRKIHPTRRITVVEDSGKREWARWMNMYNNVVLAAACIEFVMVYFSENVLVFIAKSS